MLIFARDKETSATSEINYHYNGLCVKRLLFDNHSELYLYVDDQLQNGKIELHFYNGEYCCYLAYDKCNGKLWVLDNGLYAKPQNIDGALWEIEQDLNHPLYHTVSPWKYNDGYDVVYLYYSLPLEQSVNSNPDLLGTWIVEYPSNAL